MTTEVRPDQEPKMLEYTGSAYEGDFKNGRMEGCGTYTFSNGSKFVGEMKDGAFHGPGVIHFASGGSFAAEWKDGRAVGPTEARGTYTFKDGLKFAEGDWEYCDEDDRRFYSEQLTQVNPAGISKIVDKGVPPAIPKGCFDCGDGYFNVEENAVFSYDGKTKVREPDEDEAKWIIEKCRPAL